MRIHILGIGGTFMAGIARLAVEAGHDVSGSDKPLYPPMSDQLAALGIPIIAEDDIAKFPLSLDCVIVGNVIKRGNPLLEHVMANHIPYTSGPAWLADNVLHKRKVLAVSGTHGKTTTTSILTWLLEEAGLNPGFLIGGVPENFGVSARLGQSPYFVIEADEYDTAFFDKRSKFLHYRPQVLIINNLEFDHADIYSSLEAIQQQFHFLIRTVPNNGEIIYPAAIKAIDEVLEKGYWSKLVSFGEQTKRTINLVKEDGSEFAANLEGEVININWSLIGKHNVHNAMSALLAFRAIGGDVHQGAKSLSSFKNVKRRLEVKGKVNDITIYDDFAHHPTAIKETLSALRSKYPKDRILAVVEFGSYTMRSGFHKAYLHQAFQGADMVICKLPDPDWGVRDMLKSLTIQSCAYQTTDEIINALKKIAERKDHILIMSNSAFGGIHDKLINALK